jgi:hypothetical protein
MNIKRVYNLDDVQEEMYPFPTWCNHSAFWFATEHELDEENFNYEDAVHDERIRVHLKATAEVHSESYSIVNLEYVAISFDNTYVGLVIGVDRPFGWEAEEIYITDYPKYQAMVAYAKAMFQNKPTNIVGATVKIDDLDGRFGFVIDKRYSTNMRKEEA